MSTPPTLPPENEIVRKTHLAHEASIQSVGLLYFLGAALLALTGVMALLGVGEGGGPRWLGALWILLAAAYFMIARWFRLLDRKAIVPGTILAVIGLLAFPIGTLINAYVWHDVPRNHP